MQSAPLLLVRFLSALLYVNGDFVGVQIIEFIFHFHFSQNCLQPINAIQLFLARRSSFTFISIPPAGSYYNKATVHIVILNILYLGAIRELGFTRSCGYISKNSVHIQMSLFQDF